MSKTLIVVDMQNDFVYYAPLGAPEARAIVPNVKKKIEEHRKLGGKVIFTMDTHYDNYDRSHEGKYLPIEHCLVDTDGWKLISDIEPLIGIDIMAYKEGFGVVWWDREFDNYFVNQGRDFELVGVCTDICVISNALILRSLYPECNITVDASCCAGTTPEKHKAALEVMKSCHIDVIGE